MVKPDDFLCHVVGDFILQSDWVALNKSRRSDVALLHALLYSLPFLTRTRSPAALATIAGSHFVLDRWRLARYLIWAKNWLAPEPYLPFAASDPATGFPPERPAWMTFWLFVIVDNTVHLLINSWALATFGGRGSTWRPGRAASSRGRAF